MATKKHFYSNPAFCQQSELQTASNNGVRRSPVGALQVPPHLEEASLEEQEFYEEVVVDAQGFITDKKFVVVAQNNEGKKYIQNEERHGSRYASPPPAEDLRQGSRYAPPPQFRQKEAKITRTQSMRYEYIQMQEQDPRMGPKNVTPKKNQYRDDTNIPNGRMHRYAVIEPEDEETELTSNNTRYALVPVDQLSNLVAAQTTTSRPTRSRYEYIQEQQQPTTPHHSPSRYDYPPAQSKVPPQSPSRYDYPQGQPKRPPQSPSRYDYPQGQPKRPPQSPSRYDYPPEPKLVPQSPSRYDYPPRGNPAATQKLHELLTTPRKPVSSPRRVAPPPLSPILSEFQVKTPQKQPKAQLKLNYALSTRQLASQDKRSTAIVAPMCSSPVQSVYSETTFSKSGSWSNLSARKAQIHTALSMVAMLMLVSGGATSGLCFYMISNMGRQYFLDFAVVAGFTCLVLGLLGFRSRKVSWLPNRNYISGYLVLSLLSLLTCAGLLVLLVKRPRAGTPLADITSGAVCGTAVLCLLMAASGVVSSYCCRYPPPDNRVQHCAEGFAV